MEFIKDQMKKKAVIISIKGLNLSDKEKLLLSKEKPWGIILFKRNIQSLNQLKNLIKILNTSLRLRSLKINIKDVLHLVAVI